MATAEQVEKDETQAGIGAVIDRVGMERMLEFVSISRDIQNALKSTHSKL